MLHTDNIHPSLERLQPLSCAPLRTTATISAAGVIPDPTEFGLLLTALLPDARLASREYGAVVFASIDAKVLVTVYPDRGLELEVVDGLDERILPTDRPTP